MDYCIGLDIGTTSTKAIAVSTTGELLGRQVAFYETRVPQPGWAEQNPDTVVARALGAVQALIAEANLAPTGAIALGLSSAMHSLIALDGQGRPLTPSILWSDNRSAPQAAALRQLPQAQALYERVGTPLHPMLPLAKLLWLQQAEPAIFRRSHKFVSIKEYLLQQLCGEAVIDTSIASATGLFNLRQNAWDREALAIAGIAPVQLSELVPTTHCLGGLTAAWAKTLGLRADLPVVVGASDGVLANLGVGAIAPDQVAITLGTSAAVRATVSQPQTDPHQRTFCYALTADRWVVGGASNSGGVVLEWFRDQLAQPEVMAALEAGQDAYEALIAGAASIAPGAEGLLFLPFLTGERSPYWNPAARGAFLGLASHHRRSHLTRAVLEGIVLNLAAIYRTLPLPTAVSEVRAAGGFARSPLWKQMLADGLGVEVAIPAVYDASSWGAALLALHAVGWLPDLSAVQSFTPIYERFSPDPDRTQRYRELFRLYESAYHSLESTFSALAAWQTQG